MINSILAHWKNDWNNNRTLFWCELFVAVFNIIPSVMMAFMTANAPFIPLYLMWFSAAFVATYTNYKRQSSWLTCLMAFFTLINAIALIKLI